MKLGFLHIATPSVLLFAVGAGCGPLVNDPVADAGSSGSNAASGLGTSSSGQASGSDSSSQSGTSGSLSGDSTSGASTTEPASDADTTVISGDSSESGSGSGGDASMVAAGCPGPDTAWAAGTGLPMTNWKASASSTAVMDLNGDSIAGAIDGNLATRWSSGQMQSDGDTFSLDLGQSSTISQVLLYLLPGDAGDESDAPVSYELDLSTDNTTFSAVAQGSGTAPTTGICFPRQSARYIKIVQTGSAPIAWWSINEIAVVP